MEWFGEVGDYLWRTWCYLTTGRSLAIIFGVGFALLAISLLIASRTKWGQTKPLAKCIVLSVLAHVWLLMYALGTRPILPQGDLQGLEQHMSIAIEGVASPPTVDSEAAEQALGEAIPAAPAPWETSVPLADLPAPDALSEELTFDALEPELASLPPLEPTPLPELPPLEELADTMAPVAASEDSISQQSSAEQPQISSVDASESSHQLPTQAVSTAQQDPMKRVALEAAHSKLPYTYSLRQAANRLQLSAAFGADADSEAAVKAGLEWLASAQATDGAWVAKDYGAGTETWALGEQRYGTGKRADTGVTGLALLAFLSAGHTHLEGEHRKTVEQGLRFLLHSQMPSGDLSGPKQIGGDRGVMNARMYCHGIAMLAVAEAYAMTHDAVLREALLKAAQYSINAQDPVGGGWRYRPGDPGDLSQFGWQAMALKSVERSGIPVPDVVKQRMHHFLESCSTGRSGGLARYRPGEGPPSETMTAEGLACRLLLEVPTSREAQYEATRMIMDNMPGDQPDNVYYWYYATLALFQLQDEKWRTWNQAIKQRLLTTQVPAYGKEPGSWEPDRIWGGYGGRVYSTAMSCLCLGVYYRYLPVYQQSQIATAPTPNVNR